MKILIHIERIVLHGLPVTSSQIKFVEQALRQELAEAFAAGGIADQLRSGGALPRVQAAPMTLPKDPAPAAVGRGIARAVHGGIGKPTPETRRP